MAEVAVDGAAATQERYWKWVAKCGGKVRSDLVEVYEFTDGTGRGVRARSDIEAGTVLVDVPDGALVSADNVCEKLAPKALRTVLKTALKQRKVSETDLLALFLMWARANSDKLEPEFAAYLDILPAVQEGPSALNQTMFWTEEELGLLAGTDSLQIAIKLKQQVREDFGQLLHDVLMPNQRLFPLESESAASGPSAFTYREYKWALGILWSRGMDFQNSRGGNLKSFRAMVPFADLFNTDFAGPVTHRHNAATRSVQVLAKDNYRAGDQVFINYSPTSNTRLAQLYGFALRPPRNAPNESVQLWAVMNPQTPGYAEAQQRIALALPGLDPNRQPFLLTEQDPVPAALLAALHCQRDLPVPGPQCQPAATVIAELHSALVERKQSFFNRGDRLEDLKLAMAAATLSERERIALYVRMTETRILDKAIQYLEGLLAKSDPSPPPAAPGAAPPMPEALADLEAMD